METFIAEHGASGLLWATVGMAVGGLAKGIVGFALPLVALTIMASFLPAKTAIALLILPILVTNFLQGLRNGWREALDCLRRFWRLNLVLVVVLAMVAQLVAAMSDQVMYVVLGVAITVAGTVQILGWRPTIRPRYARAAEYGTGVLSGILGGLSGIWGPPLIIYLLAIRLPKQDMVRAQSLTFFLGALVLFLAHTHSGVLDATTLPVSAALIVPALAGMHIGYRVHDGLDQDLFRKATLVVLILSGLNLLRRGAGF